MTATLVSEKDFLSSHGLEWGGISNPCLFQGKKLIASMSRCGMSSGHYGQIQWNFGLGESGFCVSELAAKEQIYRRVQTCGASNG